MQMEEIRCASSNLPMMLHVTCRSPITGKFRTTSYICSRWANFINLASPLHTLLVVFPMQACLFYFQGMAVCTGSPDPTGALPESQHGAADFNRVWEIFWKAFFLVKQGRMRKIVAVNIMYERIWEGAESNSTGTGQDLINDYPYNCIENSTRVGNAMFMRWPDSSGLLSQCDSWFCQLLELERHPGHILANLWSWNRCCNQTITLRGDRTDLGKVEIVRGVAWVEVIESHPVSSTCYRPTSVWYAVSVAIVY